MTKRINQANKMMEVLDIPTYTIDVWADRKAIDVIDLYDILTDPTKLKILLFKLHNKALL